MRTLAILMLALPLAAQNPPVEAKAAAPATTATPVEPLPPSADEQITVLLAMNELQSAIINQANKLASNQAGNEDVKATTAASQKYTAALAEMKKKAGAVDTPTSAWTWNYFTKKWVAQPVGGQ